jgi:hypothetical protein
MTHQPMILTNNLYAEDYNLCIRHLRKLYKHNLKPIRRDNS